MTHGTAHTDATLSKVIRALTQIKHERIADLFDPSLTQADLGEVHAIVARIESETVALSARLVDLRATIAARRIAA